jgi:hypothetical protein
MLVTSAPITGAFTASASLLISPMRKATGAFVNTICAPCSWHFNAVFQAIDFSSSAPNMIPRLPASKLLAMLLVYGSGCLIEQA